MIKRQIRNRLPINYHEEQQQLSTPIPIVHLSIALASLELPHLPLFSLASLTAPPSPRSVGVLAILNLAVAVIYFLISLTSFQLLHIYRLDPSSSRSGHTSAIESSGLSRPEMVEKYRGMMNDEDFNGVEGECVICMEEFDEENPRLRTHCACGENRVTTHRECIERWRER